MIDPDAYIDEYYKKNEEFLSRPQKHKFTNLNFSRLNPEHKIVPISISILLNDKLLIKEKIDWDLADEKKSPSIFAHKLISSLSSSNLITSSNLISFNITNIKNQILDSLLEHIDTHTNLPKLKLIKKENDSLSNTQQCVNCNSMVYNQDYCINCLYSFEKKESKKSNAEVIAEESRQTERQRILELKQKNINVDDIAVSYIQEGKDKKICKKCGEVNLTSATECRDCKFKFPSISYFDAHMNKSYSIHFWHKINKNSTVQQLKNFADFFSGEDFCSIKYLYNKIKHVLKIEFEDLLTEESYCDLIQHVDKHYYSYSNPTTSIEKVFDSAYYTKFNKQRPKLKMLNFNNLVDIKEGWLNDNLPDRNIDDKKEEKIKSNDPNLKRKRGRPKKMEIFKVDLTKFNENQITLNDRDNLLKSDLIITDDDMHYDFCGKCEDEGRLICCETCSSAYHYECLGYEKFPRGKFKCYFCKIVKLGIDEAVTVDKSQMKHIKKLITYNRKAKWQAKAQEFHDVIKAHPCSTFFKSAVSKDFTEFYNKIKEPKDLNIVENKLNKKIYSCLKEFIRELAQIWSDFKDYYRPNSFFYKQAETMEVFMTHLIKEEGVFDMFQPDEGITSRRGKVNYKEKVEVEIDIDEELEEEEVVEKVEEEEEEINDENEEEQTNSEDENEKDCDVVIDY